MKIRRELPNGDGFFWWRKTESDEWTMVQIVDFGGGHFSTYDVQNASWRGRSLLDWAEYFPIGEWAQVCNPDCATQRPSYPASDLFMELVTNGGSIVQECGFCGRVHFADNERAGDWDDGELEMLRANAAKEPDRYIADGEHNSIACGDLDGCIAVWGCPCNRAGGYEQFIWSHRALIGKYLVYRTRNELKAAADNNTLAEKVAKGLSENEKLAAEVDRLRAMLRLNGMESEVEA